MTTTLPIKYDSEVDAAYIPMTRIGDGDSTTQVAVEHPDLQGYVVLDFDREMRLLGVEVVGCRTVLPTGLLQQLEGSGPA